MSGAAAGMAGLPGAGNARLVHRLQQTGSEGIDRFDLVRRGNKVRRCCHVSQVHRQLVVAVRSTAAVPAIGFDQQIEQHAGCGQPLVTTVKEVGLANVSCAADHGWIEQRADRVEVGIELTVGQPPVGGDDGGDEVAGLDGRVVRVLCVGPPAQRTELLGDAADELGHVSFHGPGHGIAGYAVDTVGRRSGVPVRQTIRSKFRNFWYGSFSHFSCHFIPADLG